MLRAMQALAVRDTAALLKQVHQQWGGQSDLWVFGYASLIWRPEFDAAEQRPASVHGWHRALEMRSRVNRGTPECPGLVFALVPGGSCRGVVYRIPRERGEEDSGGEAAGVRATREEHRRTLRGSGDGDGGPREA